MENEQEYFYGYIQGLRSAQMKAFEIICDNPKSESDLVREIHKAIIEEVDTILALLD